MKYTDDQIKEFEKNFKTIHEIAKICDTDYNHICRIIAKENIIPIKSNPYMLDEDQQTRIFMVIHYESRTQWAIFPSKINTPEPEPQINYSNRLDFLKNGNLTSSGNY